MKKYDIRTCATKSIDFTGTFEEIKEYYNVTYPEADLKWTGEELKLVEEYENETDIYELIEILNKLFDGCYTVAEY